MKSKSTIIAALLSLTQACWMLEAAHAQPSEHGKRDKSQQHNRHEQQHNQRPEHPSHRQNQDALASTRTTAKHHWLFIWGIHLAPLV